MSEFLGALRFFAATIRLIARFVLMVRITRAIINNKTKLTDDWLLTTFMLIVLSV